MTTAVVGCAKEICVEICRQLPVHLGSSAFPHLDSTLDKCVHQRVREIADISPFLYILAYIYRLVQNLPSPSLQGLETSLDASPCSSLDVVLHGQAGVACSFRS